MKYTVLLLCVVFILGFQKDAPPPPDLLSVHNAIRPALTAATGMFFEGNLPGALEAFTQIRSNYETLLPPNDSLLGELYQWIGNVWYNREDADYAAALQWYEKAVGVRERPGSGHPEELVRAYRAAALSCNQLLLFSKAKNYFEKAAAVVQVRGIINPLYLANLQNGLGEHYLLTGDPDRAADYYESALEYYRKCPPTDPQVLRNMPVCLQNLGIAFDRLGKSEKAAEQYRQSIPAFRAVDNPTGEAQSHHNLGMALAHSGNFAPAEAELNTALVINQKSNDTIEMARNLAEIARLYNVRGEFTRAITPATYSLALRRKVCFRGYADLTEAFKISGDCYFGQKQFEVALSFYNDAEQNARTGGDPQELLIALAAKMRCQHQIPHLADAAFKTTLALDEAYIDTRKRYLHDDPRFRLSQMAMEHYEIAIAIASARYQDTGDRKYLDAALRFCERNKSMALVESLQTIETNTFAGVPAAVLSKEKDLRAAIYRIKADLQATHTTQAFAEAQERLLDARQNFDRFVAELENTYPAYFQLKYNPAQSLNTAAIQQHLSPDQLLVEYFEGEKTIFIFAVAPNNCNIWQCERTDSLVKSIRYFHDALAIENGEAGPEFAAAARQLYQILLERPLKELNAPQPFRSIRIVPDGELSYLSFEALLTDTTPITSADLAPYLIKQLAVSYLPANALLEKTVSDQQMPLKFGGFGIEYKEGPAHYRLPADTPEVVLLANLRDKLGVLEHADEEVRSGQSQMGGRVWLNQQVTIENFRNAGPECDVLHLALHGAIDEKNPLNSALVFSPNPDSATGLSHLLRAADIYGMSLTPRLAILSACNTGNGKFQRGEGVQSLARAFMAAGCKSQVVSLWSIPDQSTAEIMRLFFEQLKAGLPKDEALRAAKLAFIANAHTTQHLQPGFWAATVVTGDIQPLYTTGVHWMWWAAGLILALFTAGWVIRKRQSQKQAPGMPHF